MGVPDEIDGPVRKRPRLSLRTSHKPDLSKSSSGSPNVEMNAENVTGTNQSSYALVKTLDLPSECIDLPADLPASVDPLVAPVASLHNLGNTCFLNSMLEVLRYTPGFLDGLHRLQEDILLEETKCDTEVSKTDSSDVRLTWQIVKNACAMFTEMDKREEHYPEIATADASSMAVRPSALLDTIRELNPMFEGHFQHDAQELLRCLLCYIEDAEKELAQLKHREEAKEEDKDKISEAKSAVLVTEESEKMDIGVTEKHAMAHTFCSSLKGGESHDRSKITENNSRKQYDKALNILVKNSVNSEKNIAGSVTICDKDNPANQNNTAVEMDDHISPMLLEGEEVEARSSGLLSVWTSESRKRKRSNSRPALVNRMTGASDEAATTSTVRTRGLRGKAAGSDADTCCKSDTRSKNVGTHEETASVVTGSASQKHIENTAADSYSDNDSNENVQTKAAISPDTAVSPGPSTQASAAAQCETESSSSRFLSFQPLNQIKRLGVRGRAMISTICQASEQFMHGDNSNSNNIGDVNNNNDTFNSNNSRSAGVFVNNNIHVDVQETPGINRQAVSPLCAGKMGPCGIIRSPAKSPAKVELTDEILVIPLGDTSHMNSPINTVTKRYVSIVSRSSTAASSHILPSLTSQSLVTGTEPGLLAKPPSGDSPVHVLEPNKEINVTVQISPNKKASVLELNQKPGLCVPWDKLSNEKVALSTEDTSKCPVSLGDTYPSDVQSSKDRDLVLWNWRNVNDVSAHEGKSQFPETLQTSDDLTAPRNRGVSSCEKLPRQVGCAETDSACDPQSKLSLQKPTDRSPHKSSLSSRDPDRACPGQRSPGANVPHNIGTLQPKLELRKCDWLGVSPVKTVSAKEVMSILSHKMMEQGSLTARRKILYDDAESCPHSSSNTNSFINRLQMQQSHDVSCLGDHSWVIDSAPSCVGLAAAEKESKQRRSKVSLLMPARKSARRAPATNSRKQFSCTSDKILKTCQPLLPGADVSLKSLSVTLDRCDWLLETQPGLPASVQQALLDTRKGSRATSQHQQCQTEVADTPKQCHVQKAELSVSGIRPPTSAGTLVESLFGGTMMHQTKCLECEVARHRQEVFMDISVPVRSLHNNNSDDDSDEDSSDNRDKSGYSCLSKLMQACTSVERLNDANKYFCEQCMHHVEAERSCHYLTLPSVLTLHLKRFSMGSKLFGHVSKLNDKVAIPQTLPCLHYQCKPKCSNPRHTFSLFAIVTHSGTSILHGHYRAYVKVQPHVNPSVFCKLLSSKTKAEEKQRLETKIETSSNPDTFKDDSNWAAEKHGIISSSVSLCKNAGRCDDDKDVYICDQIFNGTAGTKTLASKSKYLENDVDDARITQLKSHAGMGRKFDLCISDQVKSENAWDSNEHGSFWLECDDECIKVMEEQEFIEKLEERDGCLIGTPYVLFYHKQLV